ncbi:MAG TPA: hypothetical protein VMF12_00590 [Xanthobacteraceae bacterium]|nr:hypothetical protein [Xanthobacteraceae bacterium]
MKKLVVALAALALTVSVAPSLFGQAEAAPAKNPLCKFAKAQRNPVSWNAYYHCLGPAPAPDRVVLRGRPGPAKSPFCKFAKVQRNLVSWNAFYHCSGI